MANTLIPKHGTGVPVQGVLKEGEIGIALVNGNYILYVGDKNGIANQVGFEIPLRIESGGTGATTAEGARANLELGDLATLSTISLSSDYLTDTLPVSKGGTGKASWTAGHLVYASEVSALSQIANVSGALYATGASDVPKFGTLPVAQGGTGATTVNDARTSLGLGDLATLSLVPIDKGGTGASTASEGLANLGGLPISGGVMVNTTTSKGVIDHPGNSSGWVNGRDNAFIRRSNAISNSGTYYPLVSSKTVNGDWTIGTLSNNLYVNYVNDTDYGAGNNKVAQQFWFGNDGNLYIPGGTIELATGTLGANASSTVGTSFDGTIYKNLLILIKSYTSSGNLYSSFALPARADIWKLFLPTYNDYYRAAITITGTGSGMHVMAQMDSNYSGGICWIYGTM